VVQHVLPATSRIWKDREDVTNNWREERREEMYGGWQRAIERARGWATD